MVNKRFDKELFESNDKQAKEAVEHLKKVFGVDEFRDGANRYSIDRIGYRNETPCINVEVEIKQHWPCGHEPFPYEEVNLPQRKNKYFNLPLPTFFVIFSADCQGAIIFSDKMVKDCSLEEVPNKYVPTGEYFYKIPIENCIVININ